MSSDICRSANERYGKSLADRDLPTVDAIGLQDAAEPAKVAPLRAGSAGLAGAFNLRIVEIAAPDNLSQPGGGDGAEIALMLGLGAAGLRSIEADQAVIRLRLIDPDGVAVEHLMRSGEIDSAADAGARARLHRLLELYGAEHVTIRRLRQTAKSAPDAIQITSDRRKAG